MIPELKLGIVVLTNSESNAIDAVTYQILDSYLDVKNIDEAALSFARSNTNERSARHLKDSIFKEVTQRQLTYHPDLRSFTGTYHDQWFGNVTISLQNDRLWFASGRSPQLRGFLLPYEDNTFFIRWQNPEIDADTFVLFEGGRSDTLTLKDVVPGMGFNFDGLLFQKIKDK
jgi:hypothetical protein